MIKKFVERFNATEAFIRGELAAKGPEDYDSLVKRVVEIVGAGDDYCEPSAERITVIDHGDYQGTRLYIIGASGYQPSDYWSIFVDYGSCSVCDTFKAIKGYSDEPPTEQQVQDYWTLMLHMVQGMRSLKEASEPPQ